MNKVKAGDMVIIGPARVATDENGRGLITVELGERPTPVVSARVRPWNPALLNLAQWVSDYPDMMPLVSGMLIREAQGMNEIIDALSQRFGWNAGDGDPEPTSEGYRLLARYIRNRKALGELANILK